MKSQERYLIGPGLRAKLRDTINRVDNLPTGGAPDEIATRLQEAFRRGSPIRLGKVASLAGIAKGFAGNVTVYENADLPSTGCPTGEFASPGASPVGTVCARSLIGYANYNQWVYLIRPELGSEWHIVGGQELNTCGRTVVNALTLEVLGCFGSGAKAVAGIGGDCPSGITSVTITDNGSGYAIPGRVEPSINITGGCGATFTPTLSQTKDACGIPTWSIKSVSVSGGVGFRDGEPLIVYGPATGPTVVTVEAASLTVKTKRVEPTLTATATGGTGASLTVSLKNSTTYWSVSSVSVGSAGDGYREGSSVTFSTKDCETVEGAASGVIVTAREQPALAATPLSDGVGASLKISLATMTDVTGRPAWKVSSITPTSGGSGYQVGNPVLVACGTGATTCVSLAKAISAISKVDDKGAITGVSVSSGGSYYTKTGKVDSVTVTSPGRYWREEPTSVTVANGGKYYTEDSKAAPYTTGTTVLLTQIAPSAGTGATFSATVDTSVGSPTFGEITSIAISDGGSGYFDRAYSYQSTFAGMRLSDVAGYDGRVQQILGHEPEGCLKWYNVTTCGDTTEIGLCCVGGSTSAAYTSSASCVEAGGEWKPGALGDDLPGPCCA